jgi:hypothetical protein
MRFWMREERFSYPPGMIRQHLHLYGLGYSPNGTLRGRASVESSFLRKVRDFPQIGRLSRSQNVVGLTTLLGQQSGRSPCDRAARLQQRGHCTAKLTARASYGNICSRTYQSEQWLEDTGLSHISASRRKGAVKNAMHGRERSPYRSLLRLRNHCR